MKKKFHWLQDIEIGYNASSTFLKEMDKQLRSHYEKLMNHSFDLKYLFIEPIVENSIGNVKTENGKYILECFPQKTSYAYHSPSYISWEPLDKKKGLIHPQTDILDIEMIFRWESIYISPEQRGLYKIGKMNLQAFFDYELPFKTDMEQLKSTDFDIIIFLKDNSKGEHVVLLINEIQNDFNKDSSNKKTPILVTLGEDSSTEIIKFKINGGSSDLNQFLKRFIDALTLFQQENSCIEKVAILNKSEPDKNSLIVIEQHLGYKLQFKIKIEKLNDLDFFIEIELSDKEYKVVLRERVVSIIEEYNETHLSEGIIHSIDIVESKRINFLKFKFDGGSTSFDSFKFFLLDELSKFHNENRAIKKLAIKNK